MKKIILLATVMVCFLTAEAQTITKVLGKINTSAVFLDLEIGEIKYDDPIRNCQLHFGFEYTNGQTPLAVGDSIILKGRIGTRSFPENDDDGEFKYIHKLTTSLNAEETVRIYFLQFPEPMSEYINILETYKQSDSLYMPEICGTLIHVSKYPTLSADSVKCVIATFSKKQTTTPDDPPEPGIAETVMAKVKFYPNPVTSELNITNLKNTNVEIYNVVGQRISHFEDVSGNLSIEMETFPDGIYLVRMQNGKAVRTEKIKLVK